MSEPNWSTNQFPTVERIARTPLNETVGYDGKELFAEARRLFLLYEDLLGTLTVERLEHQTVKRSLAEAEKAVEKYWPENRCPQCGTVHPAYAARVAYAEPAMALLRELAGMRRYNPNQGYESRKTTRNTLNVPTEFLARVDALLEKHPLEIGVDARSCTCHPDDNPPQPCPRKFALTECRDAARHAQSGCFPAFPLALMCKVCGQDLYRPGVEYEAARARLDQQSSMVLVPAEATDAMAAAPCSIVQPYAAKLIWRRMVEAAQFSQGTAP